MNTAELTELHNETIAEARFARTLENITRRAATLFTDGYSARDITGQNKHFLVGSPKGDLYTVHAEPGEAPFQPSCSCPAFARFDTCKHLQAVQCQLAQDAALVSDYEARFANTEGEFGCDAFARF
jgi:uncharacterized Zn finger protein